MSPAPRAATIHTQQALSKLQSLGADKTEHSNSVFSLAIWECQYLKDKNAIPGGTAASRQWHCGI